MIPQWTEIWSWLCQSQPIIFGIGDLTYTVDALRLGWLTWQGSILAALAAFSVWRIQDYRYRTSD